MTLAFLQLYMFRLPAYHCAEFVQFFQSEMIFLKAQQKSLFMLRNSYTNLRATGSSWGHALPQRFAVLTNISSTKQIDPRRKGAGLGGFITLKMLIQYPQSLFC